MLGRLGSTLLLLSSLQVLSDCFATLWTVACQAPPSTGFPRQEYWSGVPLDVLASINCVCVPTQLPSLT